MKAMQLAGLSPGTGSALADPTELSAHAISCSAASRMISTTSPISASPKGNTKTATITHPENGYQLFMRCPRQGCIADHHDHRDDGTGSAREPTAETTISSTAPVPSTSAAQYPASVGRRKPGPGSLRSSQPATSTVTIPKRTKSVAKRPTATAGVANCAKSKFLDWITWLPSESKRIAPRSSPRASGLPRSREPTPTGHAPNDPPDAEVG